MDYWDGDLAFYEMATSGDHPSSGKPRPGSWIGVTDFAFGEKPPEDRFKLARYQSGFFAGQKLPESNEDLIRQTRSHLQQLIRAWRSGKMTDEQAESLHTAMKEGVLSSRLEDLPDLKKDIAAYRQLASSVPLPKYAPGMIEGPHSDQELFTRGNIKKPEDPVKRRFLEVLNPEPYEPENSGRLELALDIVNKRNPLTARVAVNRIWHYLMGEGIVSSVDNFGRLGAKPTHPELLDHLATKFMKNDWSVKEMIRYIVLSDTYQVDSTGSPEAKEKDSQNQLLTHFRLRRLEAEAIRDSILAVSGQLDLTPAPEEEGFGSRRRSVYQRTKRNTLNPLLLAFDQPEPLSTTGRRNLTNVPAQSLAMMNSAFISNQAGQWARQVSRLYPDLSSEERVAAMFEQAMGRKASDTELEVLGKYLQGGEGNMTDIALALINMKEFIYIR